MKKKHLGLFFSICMIVFLSFVLSACGDKGPTLVGVDLTYLGQVIENNGELSMEFDTYSHYNKSDFKTLFNLTTNYDNGNNSMLGNSEFELIYEDENMFDTENNFVVNENSENVGYKVKVTYKTYSVNFTVKLLRKQLYKPTVNENISFSYNGELKNALDYIGIDESYYVIDGTTQAIEEGNYTFTIALKENCVWYDDAANTIIVNWSISKTTVQTPNFSINFQYYSGEDFWEYIKSECENLNEVGIKLSSNQLYTEYKNVGTYNLVVELVDDTYKWEDESIEGNTYIVNNAFEIVKNSYYSNAIPNQDMQAYELRFTENMNETTKWLDVNFDLLTLKYTYYTEGVNPQLEFVDGMFYQFVSYNSDTYNYIFKENSWKVYQNNNLVDFIPAGIYKVTFNIPGNENIDEFVSYDNNMEIKCKIINDISGVVLPTQIASTTYTGQSLPPVVPTSDYWTVDLLDETFVDASTYNISLKAKTNYVFNLDSTYESKFLDLTYQIKKAQNIFTSDFETSFNFNNFKWEYIDGKISTQQSQNLTMPSCPQTKFPAQIIYSYCKIDEDFWHRIFTLEDLPTNIGKYKIKIEDISNDFNYDSIKNIPQKTFEITQIDLSLRQNKDVLTFKTKSDYYWKLDSGTFYNDQIDVFYKDCQTEISFPSYVTEHGNTETFYTISFANLNSTSNGLCTLTGEGKYKNSMTFPIAIIDSLADVLENKKVGFQGTTTLTQPLEIDKNIVFNIQGTVNANLNTKNLFKIVQPVNVKFITDSNGKVNFTSNVENASLFEINHANAVVAFEGLGEFNALTSSTNRISVVNLISGQFKVVNIDEYEYQTSFISDDIGIIVSANGTADFNWIKIKAKHVGILMLGGIVDFKSGELNVVNTDKQYQEKSASGIELLAGNLTLGGEKGYLNYRVFTHSKNIDSDKFLDATNPGAISAMIATGKPEDITNCGGDITITIKNSVNFENLNNDKTYPGRGILRDITYNISLYKFIVNGIKNINEYDLVVKNGSILQNSTNNLQVFDITGSTKGTVANEAVFASFDIARPYETLYCAIKLNSYIKDGVTYKLKDAYLDYFNYEYSALTEEDANGLSVQTVTVSGVGQYVGSFTFDVKYIVNISKFEQAGYSVLTDGDIVTKAIPDDFTKPFEILGKDLTIVIPGAITTEDIQGVMTMPLATGVTNVSTTKERSSIFIGSDTTGKVSNVNIIGGGSLYFATPLDTETYYGLSVDTGSNVNLYLKDLNIKEFNDINIKEHSNLYGVYTKGTVNCLYSSYYISEEIKFMVKESGKIITVYSGEYTADNTIVDNLVVPTSSYTAKATYYNERAFSKNGYVVVKTNQSSTYGENYSSVGNIDFVLSNFGPSQEVTLSVKDVNFDGSQITNSEGFSNGYSEKTGIYSADRVIKLTPEQVVDITTEFLLNCSLKNIVGSYIGKDIIKNHYIITDYQQGEYVETIIDTYSVYENNKIIEITVDNLTNKITKAEVRYFDTNNNFIKITLESIAY